MRVHGPINIIAHRIREQKKTYRNSFDSGNKGFFVNVNK